MPPGTGGEPPTPHDDQTRIAAWRDVARLVDQVVDYAIVALDASGTVESWNAGAQELTGYSAREAIGQSVAVFYTDFDRRDGLPVRMLEQTRLKGRHETQGWRVRRDGTIFWADVITTAIYDDDGALSGFGSITRDLTTQHALEESLRNSEERFRVLVAQTRDYAIYALDPNGTIESWNIGAEHLKGYSAEEVIGRSFAMFYTPEDRRAGIPLQLLEKAREDEHVETTGWRVRKDGSQFWCDVTITALRDPDGRLTGFAKVTRDLTERKAMEEAQATFLRTIAHDLRTPLTAMKGFAELLEEAPPEMVPGYLARIEANAGRLLRMTADLSTYARSRAMLSELELEVFDLADMVRVTVETLASVHDLGRVVVLTTSAPVSADRFAMERVVVNLVDNALKYSSTGPIVVEVAAEGAWAVLSVVDHGRGIAPEDLDGIFEEFTRGRLAVDDGGTGLGLASVRSLVAQQGGSVDIDSTLGEGTTLTVRLPSFQTAGTTPA